METIFDKIIRREIPATIVYENETMLAFLDIAPVAKGHVLLIPKTRYTWIHETPDETVAELFVHAKHLIQTMIKGLSCDYVQIGVVGEEVPYVHIHLIPRYRDDILHHGGRRIAYDTDTERDMYAEKIVQAL